MSVVTATVLAAAPLPAVAATPLPAAPAAVTGRLDASGAQLIRYKIVLGRCKDTCRIKVKITNISRKTLYDVSLNARLRVNKTKVGSCYDYVGTIRAGGRRSAGCTVRSSRLASMWNRWLDGEIRWDTHVNTVVHYEYYR
ncbi:hypothetical protein [Nonomuraea rhodomycinica]|uniref:Uncharacterized protein n=1 Tax=Nonomuraea rhodomycinica TaxID=1712872 RepID=A0A7Y6IQP4_9ACTN|nr:hypothetical protein [Nonomuraea rhodomycinica]NUW42495.1 hypothetical protein [Nonomuraea rhodomycinica]